MKLLDGDLQKEGHEPRSGKNDEMIHRCLHVDLECATLRYMYYVTLPMLYYVTLRVLYYVK